MVCPQTESALEDRLSEPTPAVVETLAQIPGDILILGVAGKMGPTLARMAKRAAEQSGTPRRVIGVSRFTAGDDARLREFGIETIRCDLLNPADVAGLPDAPNVIYMPARKFGATGDEAMTWAINCYLPSLICQRYAGSRIVAFSTGNVYPLTSVASGGPTEQDAPNPVGEYGMSALGRERMFEYFSHQYGIPVSIIRLNYAVDLRYGVLVDLAKKVRAGEPIDVTMGHFNCIWQGDANAMTLRALAHTAIPPRVFNVTGADVLSVRAVSQAFGKRFGIAPRFLGTEAETALLNNSRYTQTVLGPQTVPTATLIDWVADWLQAGGRHLDKPTHFETRDGKF